MNANNIYLLDHQQLSAGNVYRSMNSSPSVMQIKSGLQSDTAADKVIFKVESDHLTPVAANFKLNNLTSSHNNHLNTFATQASCLKANKGNDLTLRTPNKDSTIQSDKEKSKEADMSVPNSLNIYVNNVVCSYSTRCHLNLRRIAMEGMHVEYKKENGMVNMKLRKPYTTATMWSSGKITCAGARSEPDAYTAARRFCRLLQKMQFKVKMTNYRVVNVLATCNMPFGVDIQRLAETHQKECSYEPELHPGATYKLIKLKATLKLFTTGSITLTAPSVLIAREAINQIYPILMEFKRALPHEQTNSQQQQIHSIKSEPTLFGMNTNSSLFNQNFSSPSIKQEMISQRPPISTISSSFNYYNNPQPMLKTTTKLMPNITNSTSVINKSTTSPQSIYNPTTTTSPPTTTATKTNITIHKSSSNPNILSPTSNQVYQLNVPTSYHQIIPAAVNSTTVTYNQAPQQPHQQQQINNSTLYVPSLNNSILNQSSSLSFPSSTSSSMIPSNPYGSSNLSQPNNGWYFDSLLVDNVDDFLP